MQIVIHCHSVLAAVTSWNQPKTSVADVLRHVYANGRKMQIAVTATHGTP